MIYSLLASREDLPPYGKYTDHAWDQNEWFQAFQRSYKGILNISLIEANVKLLTRWYYVPSRLAMIYPNASPLCFRGCNLVGSMFHIWWSCPCIRTHWNRVFCMLKKITGAAISQGPTKALLSCRVVKVSKHMQALVFFIFLGAKITLAGAWKKPSI